jgi:hypothetical protein
MLAYTQSWRSPEKIKMPADSLNHINAIMKPDNNMYIRINRKFAAPAFALVRPLRPFRADIIDTIVFRRLLTEIAMLGVGTHVDVRLESDYKKKNALECDLTFWAVQFLYLCGRYSK